MGGPLELPGDAFDLPDYQPAGSQLGQHPGALRPTPFEQQQLQQPHLLLPQAAGMGPYGGGMSHAPGASSYGFVPTGGSAPAQLGPMHGSSSGSMTLQASMRAHSAYVGAHPGMVAAGPGTHQMHAHPQSHAALLADQEATQRHIAMLQQQQAAAAMAAARPPPGHPVPGVRQPAVPQPAQPRATPRRTSQVRGFAASRKSCSPALLCPVVPCLRCGMPSDWSPPAPTGCTACAAGLCRL